MVIAVVVAMPAALVDGRVDPAAGSIMLVEEIVEVKAKDGLLHHLLGSQRIAQREV